MTLPKPLAALMVPLLFAMACAASTAARADEFDVPPEVVEAFARKLQAALKQKDVAAVSSLVEFPLRINLGGGKFRRVSKAQLAKEFDQIFSPPIVKAVLDQDPAHLFQNAQGSMFGSGAVWANASCRKNEEWRPTCPVRVYVINAPEDTPANTPANKAK